MPHHQPHIAMVLAAGLGTRMRPLTDTLPKPLIQLGGRALIDHVLDRLAEAGVERAIVNVHYLPEMLERHLAGRQHPEITFSDERGQLLDTGGGVKKALNLLGREPFFVHNSDSVWSEDEGEDGGTLTRMAAAWRDADMDALLLLADAKASIGYDGAGDFFLEETGRLRRRRAGERAPFVFAGVSIAHPRLFDDSPAGRFSINAVWDRALEAGRVYGFIHRGLWMHVGTPEALAQAESCLRGGATLARAAPASRARA